MAAPTNAAYVKKALANSEPSTHGTQRRCRHSSLCPVLKVERPPSRCRFTLTGLITDVTRGRQGRNSNLLETGSRLWTNELVDCYRAGNEALVRRGYGTCFVFQISRWWSSCGRLTDLLRSKVNCWALRRLSPTSSTELSRHGRFPLECRQPSRGQETRKLAEGCRTTSGTRSVTDHEPGTRLLLQCVSPKMARSCRSPRSKLRPLSEVQQSRNARCETFSF